VTKEKIVLGVASEQEDAMMIRDHQGKERGHGQSSTMTEFKQSRDNSLGKNDSPTKKSRKASQKQKQRNLKAINRTV